MNDLLQDALLRAVVIWAAEVAVAVAFCLLAMAGVLLTSGTPWRKRR